MDKTESTRVSYGSHVIYRDNKRTVDFIFILEHSRTEKRCLPLSFRNTQRYVMIHDTRFDRRYTTTKTNSFSYVFFATDWDF